MPEHLLGRIIRACTSERDVVLDPFSGSATTLSVAKKYNRNFFGFEISKEYVDRGTKRLESTAVGDLLDGAIEPKASAPSTFAYLKTGRLTEPTEIDRQMVSEANGIIEAFSSVHRGFSVDRVVADPILNEDFQLSCDRLSIPGSPSDRNRFLFRLRKSGRMKRAGIETSARTDIDWYQVDEFLHASEIAWKQIANLYSASLDEIFCDPRIAKEFDQVAQKFAPGHSSLEYRWAAFKLRKEAGKRRLNLPALSTNVGALLRQKRFEISEFDTKSLKRGEGVYALCSEEEREGYVYIGETHNLRRRLNRLFEKDGIEPWVQNANLDLKLQFLETPLSYPLANQLALLKRTKGSKFNYEKIAAV